MNKATCFCVAAWFVFGAVSVSAQPAKEIRDDLKKYFDAYKVDGSFALFDLNKEQYLICNERQFREPFIQTGDAENSDFGRARIEITRSILRELGLM